MAPFAWSVAFQAQACNSQRTSTTLFRKKLCVFRHTSLTDRTVTYSHIRYRFFGNCKGHQIIPKMSSLPCDDYSQFKQVLIKLRKVDDFVVNKLNTVVPTDTFKRAESVEKKHEQCESLYKQLQEAYADRREAISNCIRKVEGEVDLLRNQRNQDRDNPELKEKLSDTHMRLRLIQNELPIEDVIEERSMKAFRERCNTYDVVNA